MKTEALVTTVLLASSSGTCHHAIPVLLFQPKYRLGHPENYLFLLSKKIFTGSKYPKNKLIKFEKRNTGRYPQVQPPHQALCGAAHWPFFTCGCVRCAAPYRQCFFVSRNIVRSPWKLFFLLSRKIVSGSKYPKNILFNFENRSTFRNRADLDKPWLNRWCRNYIKLVWLCTNTAIAL